MATQSNTVPPGFLRRHARSEEPELYLPLALGFLRLEYDGGALRRVSFVIDRSARSPAIGPCLEIVPDLSRVTFIEENAVSGLQWSNGQVRWGHTYEDDSPPASGREVGLEAWVDHCLATMIEIPRESRAALGTRFDLKTSLEKLRAGDESTRELFWKRCTPASEAETATLLELVRWAALADRGFLFSCGDPLARATAGQGRILKELTRLLEEGTVGSDFDRSELQEVLAAHAREATEEIAGQWIAICRRALAKKGAGAFAAIAEGWLFEALARTPRTPARQAFFDEVLRQIDASPAGRGEVEDLRFFRAVREASSPR